MSHLENKLINRAIRPTAMRLLVLQYLMEHHAAVSLKILEEQFYKSDKSTLYRTLITFEKKGLVHQIDDGTGMKKYALCLETCNCAPKDQHFHFHCTKCSETFCLTGQNVPNIALPIGFQMQKANMVIKGFFANCSH